MASRIIEINGIKCEIDDRHITKVEEYRVGTRVKCLVKNYSGYAVHPGVIVSIDAFEKLPTINVAYVPDTFGTAGEVKFQAFNANTTEFEIVPLDPDDILPSKETIRDYFDKSIAKKRAELQEMEDRKGFFLRAFGRALHDESAVEA